MEKDVKKELTSESTEEFGELIKYTISGFAGGLAFGALLDHFGFSKSGIGQWIVRTLSGEGESILGDSPSTQVLTAAETMAANLCWVPPLVGYITEKRKPNSG